MQKISPLRTSIEAFNKFKAQRAKNETQEAKPQATNPFGIAFKGRIVEMDVFEKTTKTEDSKTNILKEKMDNTKKLLASAWVGTINKFSGLKSNIISFGNKIKDNTVNVAKQFYEYASQPMEFNVFKYTVSNLQNQPVGDLRAMLSHELQGV